ncbi:MAG: hypothetical protein QF395_03530 [Arenicellales bacterium]|nr:hypothetical protein [Arenicellales bacterium]
MATFSDLFCEFEVQLGKALLPLDPRARSAERLVSTHAVYLELARSAARAIFQENGCAALADPVTLYPTLDALGRVKQQMHDSSMLDLGAAEFLEQLGQVAIAALESPAEPPITAAASLPPRTKANNRGRV